MLVAACLCGPPSPPNKTDAESQSGEKPGRSSPQQYPDPGTVPPNKMEKICNFFKKIKKNINDSLKCVMNILQQQPALSPHN